MYVKGAMSPAGGILPNTGDNWLLMTAGIVTAVAGVAIIVTTVAFMIAKKKAAKKA